ncbi:hypothetical protein FOZ63_025942 [Perkinsus olseni]|uniref:Uncharacterized protein n=1 Tax=Perkinsus olseni TaxID=32597 RepID=A0A7J6S405_PEROL|nr:hypothetical protein FOZ63_025942 [Perkinsus olseni]
MQRRPWLYPIHAFTATSACPEIIRPYGGGIWRLERKPRLKPPVAQCTGDIARHVASDMSFMYKLESFTSEGVDDSPVDRVSLRLARLTTD